MLTQIEAAPVKLMAAFVCFKELHGDETVNQKLTKDVQPSQARVRDLQTFADCIPL